MWPGAVRVLEKEKWGGESIMARVSVLGVLVMENPSPFSQPLRFQVQFECGEALPHGKSRGGETRRDAVHFLPTGTHVRVLYRSNLQ